jgi:hypothetical protein
MKRLLAALAFIASTAVADELHSVDPKTVIERIRSISQSVY